MSASILAPQRQFATGAETDLAAHPFGTLAPTATQAALIALARRTPLHRGAFRHRVGRLLDRLRPGPLDVTRAYGRFRLWHLDNLIESGILLHPAYNRAEIGFLRDGVAGGGTFVDIGANVGLYAIAVATLAPAARVLAIEPGAVSLARLGVNIVASGLGERVAVAPVAAGAVTGRGTLVFDNDLAIARFEGAADGELKILPLPEILDRHGIGRIEALKIDIEGREDEALGPLLDEETRLPGRIVIEHMNAHEWRADLFARLAAAGYREVARTRQNAMLVRAGMD